MFKIFKDSYENEPVRVEISADEFDLKLFAEQLQRLEKLDSRNSTEPIRMSEMAGAEFTGVSDVIFVPSDTSRLSFVNSTVRALVTPSYASRYVALIQALMAGKVGHQYLDAETNDEVELVVSLGEDA